MWGRVRRVWHRFGPSRAFGREVAGSADPGCALDAFDELLFVLVLVLVLLLVVFFVAPLVLALLDLLFVIVLVALGVVARVVFRRPWRVEAEALDGAGPRRLVTWRVVGWRASGAHVEAVARHLEAGVDVPVGGDESLAEPATGGS